VITLTAGERILNDWGAVGWPVLVFNDSRLLNLLQRHTGVGNRAALKRLAYAITAYRAQVGAPPAPATLDAWIALWLQGIPLQYNDPSAETTDEVNTDQADPWPSPIVGPTPSPTPPRAPSQPVDIPGAIGRAVAAPANQPALILGAALVALVLLTGKSQSRARR
jgi:hypothetical protein